MGDDSYDPNAMRESLESAMWLQALIFRHIAAETTGELGAEEGRARLATGLREYGRWRGQAMAARIPAGADAFTVARDWDAADLRLPIERGYPGGGFCPATNVAEFSVQDCAEWREWRSLEDRTLVRLYYTELLAGIAEGYGRDLRIEHSKYPDLKSLFTVRLTTPHGKASIGPLENETLADRAEARELLMRTNHNFAALYYFLAREIMAGPSLSGEKAVRAATRNFAIERADRLRARHEADGKPINLKTMMEDYDLPRISLWEHDKARFQLTETRMYDTCTFCPYAEVWRKLPGGLEIGYIYDYEFHLYMYQAYLPGTIAEFAGVMTKGDPVCNFRFRAPQPATA